METVVKHGELVIRTKNRSTEETQYEQTEVIPKPSEISALAGSYGLAVTGGDFQQFTASLLIKYAPDKRTAETTEAIRQSEQAGHVVRMLDGVIGAIKFPIMGVDERALSIGIAIVSTIPLVLTGNPALGGKFWMPTYMVGRKAGFYGDPARKRDVYVSGNAGASIGPILNALLAASVNTTINPDYPIFVTISGTNPMVLVEGPSLGLAVYLAARGFLSPLLYTGEVRLENGRPRLYPVSMLSAKASEAIGAGASLIAPYYEGAKVSEGIPVVGTDLSDDGVFTTPSGTPALVLVDSIAAVLNIVRRSEGLGHKVVTHLEQSLKPAAAAAKATVKPAEAAGDVKSKLGEIFDFIDGGRAGMWPDLVRQAFFPNKSDKAIDQQLANYHYQAPTVAGVRETVDGLVRANDALSDLRSNLDWLEENYNLLTAAVELSHDKLVALLRGLRYEGGETQFRSKVNGWMRALDQKTAGKKVKEKGAPPPEYWAGPTPASKASQKKRFIAQYGPAAEYIETHGLDAFIRARDSLVKGEPPAKGTKGQQTKANKEKTAQKLKAPTRLIKVEELSEF